LVVGLIVGLVDKDGGEDGVSVVEYVRLKNVVTVGLDDEDGGGDGGTVIYDAGVPVFDDARSVVGQDVSIG
jgi:hypothetical protein